MASVALPSSAAAPRAQITDPKGDANGLNDQGLGVPVPSTSTPVDDSGADIVSVLFQSTFVTKAHKKVPSGLTITLTLAAPPVPEHIYRVTANGSTCSGNQLFFEYATTVGASPPGDARCPGTVKSTDVAVTSVIAKLNTITWTVPLSASIRKGERLTGLGADVRVELTKPGVTAPAIDEATGTASFVVGR
ncbi:MAG: hypothetical protein ACTHK4_17960 [Mycobacteriales bacterium]